MKGEQEELQTKDSGKEIGLAKMIELYGELAKGEKQKPRPSEGKDDRVVAGVRSSVRSHR